MTRPEYCADEVPKMAAELKRLRARVADLEGEIDRQRCVAEAQGHGEALAYLDDLMSRARALASEPGPTKEGA